MNCEMCGKETDVLYKAVIEGVELKVCKECSKFGTKVRPLNTPARVGTKNQMNHSCRKMQPKRDEIIYIVVPGYDRMIKEAREKAGMKQEEFSKKINEKESTIHNIESGRAEPSIKLARKIEKFFHIKLLEELTENEVSHSAIAKPSKSKELTVGDVIQIKTRKKK